MMKSSSIQEIPSVKTIVLLSLTISLLLHISMTLAFWFGDGIVSMQMIEVKRPAFHLDGLMLNILFSFLLAFLLCSYNTFIHKKIHNKVKRIIILIIGSILLTIVLSSIFSSLHPYILGVGDRPMPIKTKVAIHRNILMRDFFVTMVVTLSCELIISNNKRKRIVLENEILVTENLRTRYEVLKNQMNPHFLFNSLNTLQSLIETDKDKAQDYVQELSRVLRYSLQNQEVVSLQEELNLANSFCALMKIRYGDNINFSFDINENVLKHEIIPLSLQVLIENAIKHNVISDKQPLTINIATDEDGNIMVVNKKQPKMNPAPGNGIGLANLSERYSLKWNRDIDILNDDEYFKVLLFLNNPYK